MRATGVLNRPFFRFAFRTLFCSQTRRVAHGKATPRVVTEETTELILPSRVEAVADAAAAVAEVVRRAEYPDEAAFGIDMAVREAVTNAVLHGNLQDETKTVEVSFVTSADAIEITVRDMGTGFNIKNVPDPTDAPNLLKTSGRGIFFMRTFMDQVEWSSHPEGGTIVRMTKKT
jgi:serine/threonine-protein kinase RsbW